MTSETATAAAGARFDARDWFKPAFEALHAGRRDAILTDAAQWLDHGISLQVAEPVEALGPLMQAVALGSNEAMTWLGLTLIDLALVAEPTDVDAVTLAGIGWLESAMMAGEYHARAWFPEALRKLTDAQLLLWKQRPAHSQAMVN